MTTLSDALYNLHPDSGSSAEYAKGVLVGVVAAIMHARNCNWEDAIEYISTYLPRNSILADAMPESWQNKLGEYRTLVSD